MIIEDKAKGDALNFDITINYDTADWKIRAEIFDGCGNSSKIASSNNAGGSAASVERIDEPTGRFILHFEAGETTCFDDIGYLEVEIEDTNGKIYTPIIGSETIIYFKPQKIKWTNPNE